MGRRVCPERLPMHIHLIGIEGGNFEPFTDMSPEVSAAVGAACEAVMRIVGDFLEG